MAVECPVLSCRNFPGEKWIGMGPGARKLAVADNWIYFYDHVAPANRVGWVETPAERIEYDEIAGRVRLFVEGVALVPDVVGHPVGRRIPMGGETDDPAV